MVISTTSPLNLLIWPVQKTGGLRKITVDHNNLNQVVTPIAASVPEVVSLLEEINVSPGSWNAAIDLANIFFPPYLSVGSSEAVCLELARPAIQYHCLTSSLSTLLLYVIITS